VVKKTKRAANRGEHVVPIPSVVEPVEIEVPLAIVLVQHEHVAVAVHLDRSYKISSVPPPLEYS